MTQEHEAQPLITTFASEGIVTLKKTARSWKWLRRRRPVILAALSAFITVSIVGSIALASRFLAQTTIDSQSQAAILGAATISWPVANTSLPVGVPSTLALTANPGNVTIDGLQVVVAITGTSLPTLTFVPNTSILGLELAGSQLTPTTGGQLLRLAFVSQNPEAGYNATGSDLNLGSLQFTPTSAMSMSLAFEGGQTAVIDHISKANIVGSLINPTYTFQPVVSPTLSPSSSPLGSPSIVPTPSVVPTPSPTPTPDLGEIITVKKATLTRYPFGLSMLSVAVSDSLGSSVQLKVTDFGSLVWNRRSKQFAANWYTTKSGLTEVEIISSTGKKITVPLQLKTVRLKYFR